MIIQFLDLNLINLLILVFLAGIIFYRITFLSKKSIGYFSLLQLIFLVIMPAFLFVITFSYIQDILARPLNGVVFIPDSILIYIFLLSSLFTYGGVAIHSVTKMLSEVLRHEQSRAAEINKHFHLIFSHNLAFSGILFMLISISLLQLNHINLDKESNIFTLAIKGLTLGVIALLGLKFYTKSKDGYRGYWSDLKVFFIVVWMGLVFLFYGIKKTNPNLADYDLFFFSIIVLALLALLNMFLVLRRLKRGGFSLLFGIGKKKEKILEIHPEDILKKKKK